MKLLKTFLISIFALQSVFAEIPVSKETALYTEYAILLESYATSTGVDYEAWYKSEKDLSEIDEILATWAALGLSKLSTSQQKAFYINLYNLGMIRAVFDHYPIDSVTEILPNFGIFTKKFIRQGDRTLSLDDIEKVILLKEYPDARIHFAVNCASRSCPPLRQEPFVSTSLDAQMDEQTKVYLNDPWGVQIEDGTAHISALFDWYRSDFPEGNLINYINAYRSGTKLPTDLDIQFLEYDWALNTPLPQ